MQKPNHPYKSTPRPGEWTDVLATDIISHFVGQHVAIINKRVVAVGNSYETVLAEAREKFPEEVPYLMFIPNPDDDASPTTDTTVTQA